MDQRHFQLFARGFDLGLKAFALVTIVISLMVGYALLFLNGEVTFSFTAPVFSLFRSYETPSTQLVSNMSAIVGFCSALIDSFLLFRGSQVCARISQGQTPFTTENYRVIKQIAIILLIVSLVEPLVYSLLVTIGMEKGYYIVFGLGYQTFMGILVYLIAEIIHYGSLESGVNE
ncbi:hypothetical protein [uncultured Enterococcus sp.]|uniref:hypothetical protein n=1 Tax=uncultured Enterococcus sp. TaxID=167972 RepID=UPI0025F07807|nr:hypothetical protein [uncultured Enterococcus sp.]